MSVLVVIVRSPLLRVQLTNFFVVNLCVVDLLAAVLVMPMSLASINTSSLSTNVTTSDTERPRASCDGFRVLSTFVVFASILSTLLANVERFVSIRFPMRHAAHLTVSRTLASIGGVWTAAVGVATAPVVADWEVLDTGTRCCVGMSGSTSTAAAAFVIVVVTLLFIAPTLTMALMCCSIYAVARQAGRQVAPGFDDGHRPPAPPPPPRRISRRLSTYSDAGCSVVRSSVSCPALNNIQPHNDVAKSTSAISEHSLTADQDTHGDPAATLPVAAAAIRNIGTPECVIRVASSNEVGSSTGDHDTHVASPTPTRVAEGQLRAGVVADRRWKAAATLLFVLMTFVLLWSPYFAYSVCVAVERSRRVLGCATAVHIETTVVWTAFVSFASNAFVYGWMNRSIRDALYDTVDATFGRCWRAAQGRARLSQVLGDGDDEDFFQFLERTSSFDRTQSLIQTSTTSVELTATNRTGP